MRQSLNCINLFAFCFEVVICEGAILCANLHKEYHPVDIAMLSVFLDIQIGDV